MLKNKKIMDQEILDQLETMKTGLEAKSKEQIAAEVKTINAMIEEKVAEKSKELVDAQMKDFKESVEAEHTKAMDELQDHLDQLDVRLKEARKAGEQAGEDPLKLFVKDNFEAIKGAVKGQKVSLESKDMTLGGNLTGDQPRVYSQNVAMVPSQLINFADLITSVTIDGGTYTFPRETGSSGSGIGTQVEGADKGVQEYALTMVDVNTDFIAGIAVYSKKMANNLPFLESFLPRALRRDYWKAENGIFNTVLAAAATASTQIITGKNKVEMLINEVATLEEIDFAPNVMVVRPADYYDILKTEKSTGAGYGLPGIVSMDGGVLRINGIPVFKANWLAANKYYVGDWTQISKIITEGLSVEFSTEDTDNFRKNNITARVESQVGLAVERTDAVIYGDFTAV